jgi:glycosyltransferase involved in cell wall biosynthesis
MNILQIISSAGMYGAESVILALSRALNARGHRTVLGVFDNLSNPNREFYERATRDGIDSRLIVCKGQIDRGAIARIRKLALETEADIVHSHGYKADIYAYCALRNCRPPLVSTCHNWIDEDFRAFLYGIGDRQVLRLFGGVVAVSDDVKRRLLQAGVLQERIRVIRNGLDLSPFATGTPVRGERDGVVIGLVGRLSREKGVDILIHAASKVLVTFPNTAFVIVGDGPDRKGLQKLVDELGIGSRVSLVGRRDDMPSVYRSFDIMVSSSRAEGLPIALLEGMANGLPVIATAVGEVPVLIQNGQTGLLLPPENPLALASAIVELLADGEYRTRLGCAARRLVEGKYSSERMADEYLCAYGAAVFAGNQIARQRMHRSSSLNGESK